jgi:hypothetical protein
MSTSEEPSDEQFKETIDLFDNISSCLYGKNYYTITNALVFATSQFVHRAYEEDYYEEFFDNFKSQALRILAKHKDKNKDSTNVNK